jgi:hypothetical protein
MGRTIQPFALLYSVKVRAETLRFWPERAALIAFSLLRK